MIFSLSLALNGGNKITTAAEGELTENSCRLSYVFDGADYLLTADGDGLISVRGGVCPLEIRFKSGEDTLARIGVGSECGYVPVKTLSFRTTFGRYGCRIAVEYLLGNDKRSAEIVAVREEKL